MNPSVCVQSICAATDGGRSSATITDFPAVDDSAAALDSPVRFMRTRPITSWRSPLRSRRRIVGLIEHRAELVARLLHRPFGVAALAANQLGGARGQHRIVEHQDLRLEQRRRRGAGETRVMRAEISSSWAREVSRACVSRSSSCSTALAGTR